MIEETNLSACRYYETKLRRPTDQIQGVSKKGEIRKLASKSKKFTGKKNSLLLLPTNQ